MTTNLRRSTAFLLATGVVLAAPSAFAETVMNGNVSLDYYVSGTDTQGFESTSSDLFVQQIDNTGGATGPLSLAGWATKGSSPAGDGREVGYAPIGPAPANSVIDNFSVTTPADDLAPGEYHTHVLLQDDSAPGTYDDARSLTPSLLWRGGLEAVGPMRVSSYDAGRRVSVSFDQLRNNRIDSRYTNDIVLTLYATYGYGPASDGYTLCSVRVDGLYAGDRRYDPGFDCAIGDVPDGDYTLHLEVAEAGGRGGSSTLSGPDQYFSGDRIADHSVVVSAGALSPWILAPLLALALLRPWFRHGSWVRAHTAGMKKETAMRILSRLVLGLVLLPLAVQASAHASSDAHFSTAELDRLLAPVALYPDSVLTHVLAAATYPLEVVEAARWAREHPKLRGEKAVNAVGRMNWDPSVKALVAFPDLLARMDSDLQWTQDLGDAFLGSEGDVMDRVQYLRDRADESGHLKSVEHVRVVRERELIYIEPEAAEVIYVPYYDPLVVYGDWWWPAYPPHRWVWWAGHPVSYYSYYGTFYWGLGFPIAPSFYFCAFDWPRREVVVVNHYDVTNNYYYGHSPQRYEGANRWQHEPEHRHGVAYREPAQNEQWHRGYSRSEGGDRAQDSTRAPRGEWTVNRAEHPGRNPQEQGAEREQRREVQREGRVEERQRAPRESRAERQEQRQEQPARTQRMERPERAERPERQARPEPPERPQRQERPERAEKPVRQQQRREAGAEDGGDQGGERQSRGSHERTERR